MVNGLFHLPVDFGPITFVFTQGMEPKKGIDDISAMISKRESKIIEVLFHTP